MGLSRSSASHSYSNADHSWVLHDAHHIKEAAQGAYIRLVGIFLLHLIDGLLGIFQQILGLFGVRAHHGEVEALQGHLSGFLGINMIVALPEYRS